VLLRPYQTDLKVGIEDVWLEQGTPLAVAPTGSGKTVVFASVIRTHGAPAVVIAHRRELVGQISLALAREEVHHRIISPSAVVRQIIANNTRELGRHFYSATAPVAVASVDSIHQASETWRRSVTLWVMDESHHLLRENKWGRAVALFPNAKGLGVTATPQRADGKGLGRHADGVFTHIVPGPPMRELMADGYLTDYRIYAPPSALKRSAIKVSSSTGDFVAQEMKTAVAKAQITGDVVQHYLRFGAGKLGVTFAVGVDEAHVLAAAYRTAGVPAEVVHAKTPAGERNDIIRRFTRRELLQLVNVDIFGEGFDLPAIEVVSFVRPTKSFALYAQSFGRALRPMTGKSHAIIIDHVGNVLEHGLPDAPRSYSLDRAERRAENNDPNAVKVCLRCAGVYLRILTQCPYCSFVSTPTQRSSPEFVDGDLVELAPEVLESMRAAIAQVDRPAEEYAQELLRRGCPEIGIRAHVKRHRDTQEAQQRLRHTIAWWRGVKAFEGHSERECYRLFYLSFGIDVLSAHALTTKSADSLANRIRASLPFAAQCMSL